ncbi:MAG: radical SAM family heme chaperone HemW [Gammaproteobacteria bacterium]|jgi:putative oxygen-independent coproporphyrinogen III oxidase
MFNFTALPPLSLYVHLPWCVRKCPYCDFNSHEVKDAVLPEQDYINALIADLEQELPAIWGRPVETVFVGGGTPSLFSPDAVDRLVSQLRALLALPATAEITLEANPGTLEAGRFAEFRAAGINRLSIGIQSFDDAMLGRLERIHDARQAIAAAETARAAGFEEFNLDLMYGLPGQTGAQAVADLEQAIALQPTHLSHYQLAIEPNTRFAHSPPVRPDDDEIGEMQSACQARLAAAGFENYEVSAYARPGHHCRHNLNYWRFGDYLGIGAGAHGKLSSAQPQGIRRCAKLRHPRDYLARAAGAARIAEEHVLNPREAGFEFMLNALRLNEGFAVALFAQHTGLPLSTVETPLHTAESRGLIERDMHTIRPTALGRRFLNDLTALFLPGD